MPLRWEAFEDQVREIASHVHGHECRATRVHGSDIDGVIALTESDIILIEITTNHSLDKVRSDAVKLTNVRNALFLEKRFARCLIITHKPPTQAMIQAGVTNNIDVWDVHQLAAVFFQYDRYRVARLAYPFGSAVDPESGKIDTTRYVPVPYVDRTFGRSYSHSDVAERLSSGQNIVIIGEYGTGKSRCVSEVFNIVAASWGDTFRFPVAVNLRECWGLEDAHEIIRRHFTKLGLDDMRSSAVKGYNRKTLIFLLDGFDEIGTQSWSPDAEKLREVRARALSGVQDIVRNSGTGTLITGREHYFSSDREMLKSLGLPQTGTLILHVRDEFSLDELTKYFQVSGIDVTLPDWLPRRPLICQTISQLPDHDRDSMFGEARNEAEFWDHFIQVICARDARINKSFDAETIYEVLISLANLTRTKESDTGPINQRELQEAFESVVGALPVENASVMLQRLPSLGRVDSDNADRRFIDTYILDGLRAHGIRRFVDADEKVKTSALMARWANPLRELGQKVLARSASTKRNGFLSLCRGAAEASNRTMAADIIASFLRLTTSPIDVGRITIDDATISVLDFSDNEIVGLEITNSTVEEIILPEEKPSDTTIKGCLVSKVSGASSKDGLSSWVSDNIVEEFDSVRTMKRIRDAGLNPAHEVLVVIVKKVFFQPGTGRKEEALLRGLESGRHNKIARKVLGILVSGEVLGTFKGDEGLVYTPNRSQTSRMQAMLDELRASHDPIWKLVGEV